MPLSPGSHRPRDSLASRLVLRSRSRQAEGRGKELLYCIRRLHGGGVDAYERQARTGRQFDEFVLLADEVVRDC